MRPGNTNKVTSILSNPIIDRLLLIGSGAVVTILAVAGLLILDHHYHLSRDWQFFAMFAVGYFVTTAYGIKKTLGARPARMRLSTLAIPIAMALCVVLIGGALFYFKVVPFPRQNIWPWGIGMTLLAMATTVVSAELSDRMHKKEKDRSSTE